MLLTVEWIKHCIVSHSTFFTEENIVELAHRILEKVKALINVLALVYTIWHNIYWENIDEFSEIHKYSPHQDFIYVSITLLD